MARRVLCLVKNDHFDRFEPVYPGSVSGAFNVLCTAHCYVLINEGHLV